MTLDESVHGMRLRVIERAQVLGNVSAVCRELAFPGHCFIAGGSDWSSTGQRAYIRAGSGPSRAVRPARRRRSSGSSWGSRSVPQPGAAAGSPPTWPGPGSCAWRPAPCSGCCAASVWPRDGRG